jgi:hypothetical protein
MPCCFLLEIVLDQGVRRVHADKRCANELGVHFEEGREENLLQGRVSLANAAMREPRVDQGEAEGQEPAVDRHRLLHVQMPLLPIGSERALQQVGY